MVRIHVPACGPWLEGCRNSYWAQNNLEGTGLIQLRAGWQAMELLCEVHRVVRVKPGHFFYYTNICKAPDPCYYCIYETDTHQHILPSQVTCAAAAPLR